MEAIKFLTWLGLFLIFYSYIGYALIVWLMLKLRRRKKRSIDTNIQEFEPSVSLIMAVFNEEDVIAKKIENCFALNYPANKLKLIFVADGSTDGTVEIIKGYPQVELLYQPERRGKVAAINRAMTSITTEYTIFCDANTMLNKDSIREIIKHYTDEKIGAVAGEKKVIAESVAGKTGKDGEGAYWKYESRLKQVDSDFYSVVGAAGELFSIRTKLFEPVPDDVLLDDFIISMNICRNGYRVVYEPKAYAIEHPSLTMEDEKKRKIRISAGGFQSIVLLSDLLNIFKYGRLSFLYISHRVLRWALCPILLPLVFFCSMVICYWGKDPYHLYEILFKSQLIFYGMALLGWFFHILKLRHNLFYIPFYFVFMNLALYIGFFRFISKKQTVLWDKARRK